MTDWLHTVLLSHSSVQTIVVLCCLCAIGLAVGKWRIAGISLGVTCVFFAGILAGHLGVTVNEHMLRYAQDFGLVLFVYALGLQVGPGFFNSLHHSGIRLNMLALALVMCGVALAACLPAIAGIALPDAIGLMCGASTNTPALGAAQQTLQQLGLPATGAALACAVTYPFGVVGVILALQLMRKLLPDNSPALHPEEDDNDNTYIAAYQVINPAIFGKRIGDLAHISHDRFVISRLWRGGKVTIPSSDTVLQPSDRVLVISRDDASQAMTILFGEQESTDWNVDDVDWNAIDSNLISQAILITRPSINGRRLGSLRLRNHYGVNVSRIMRNGVPLLATPDLHLLMGDRLVVVGEKDAVAQVEQVLGNAVEALNEPRLISVFVGITLGMLLGAVPIALPGITSPVRLGLAGGPIIVGILMGTFGPRIHMNTYTTQSANMMLRAIGLSLYLACLGLEAGHDFFSTVMRPEGLMWLAAGAALTLLPVLLAGIAGLRCLKLDFATVSGLLCGAMANPMALNYATGALNSQRPAVAYATVYPLSMFVRVVLAQIVLLFML